MTTTIAERRQRDEEALQRCEEVIGRGLATFLEVGAALLEIKTNELYRRVGSCHYRTFNDYCRERWQMSARQANREILAARTARLITAGDAAAAMTGPIGPAPRSESQARALGKLVENPAAVRRVWGDAVEAAGGGQPTAAQVKEARQQYEAEQEPAGPSRPVEQRSPEQGALARHRRYEDAKEQLGRAAVSVRHVARVIQSNEFSDSYKEHLAALLAELSAEVDSARAALAASAGKVPA